MLKVNFTRTPPTKPGKYLVLWDFTGELSVSIVYWCSDASAMRATGASTHYSRWHCQWSDPIEVG